MNPTPPTQLNVEDAVALLPATQVVSVIQRHAMPGKADLMHRWHRDFAADKLRHMGAHRAWDAPRANHGVRFADSNGDTYFVETAPSDVAGG